MLYRQTDKIHFDLNHTKVIIMYIISKVFFSIKGQLRDIYGTYDGAFYFAAGAMLTGAAVLTIGNV